MAANKPTVSQADHTPERMTNLIVANMAKDIKMYGNYSNAYLALFPGYINGPVWCMDLYIGKKVHLAILEEFMAEDRKHNLIVYTGSLRPNTLFDEGQLWEHKCKAGDMTIHQIFRYYQNKKGESCLKVTYVKK